MYKFGLLHGFSSICGFSSNLPAGLLFEQCAHASAYDIVVVRHE